MGIILQSSTNVCPFLFHFSVFHQADGAGNPVMDLGHVTTALNKLDAADEEKIVLSSRDGKSLMVVSYADVARCLENAYHELYSGSIPPSTALQY
jgi:PAB-dependent poly(A)-specific ribonuclease subunit 3